jgi:hypothetical protein
MYIYACNICSVVFVSVNILLYACRSFLTIILAIFKNSKNVLKLLKINISGIYRILGIYICNLVYAPVDKWHYNSKALDAHMRTVREITGFRI